jgi:hypothetical protein
MLEPFCAPHKEASSCSASRATSDSLSEIASTAVALLKASVDLQGTEEPSSQVQLWTHAFPRYEHNQCWFFIRKREKKMEQEKWKKTTRCPTVQ